MATALDGLRVVEVGDFISAAYCTKLLADLGADVIKIEPPGGDSSRRYGPFRGDIPDSEGSGLFVYLNTNKRDVAVDLRTPAGRAILDGLLGSADVLVENLDRETLAAFGLEHAGLQARFPSLIVTSISAFGRRGPRSHYRGHGLQASAGSTVAFRTGAPGRAPLIKPLNEPEFLGGLHGAVGTLVAHRYQAATWRGQHVDIAIQDVLAAVTSGQGLAASVAGTRPVGQGRSGHRVGAGYPWMVLPVADGYMEFICLQDRQWRAFLDALGDPEWGRDPRFAERFARGQFADELDGLILQTVGRLTRAELWQLCRERMVPFQPVHRIDELVESDHLRERNFFQTAVDGAGRPMTVPGPPYKLSGTPWVLRTPAPRFGQHTADVLMRELGLSPRELMALSRAGVISSAGSSDATRANGAWRSPRTAPRAAKEMPHPLEGIRVLDLGQVWAGPLLGCYLADFGAQVIKIGSAARDAVVTATAQSTDPADPRAYDALPRNRLSISLNLHCPAGQELFHRLVAISDVVFDNFSPRGAEKLGLRYERLREVNPRIIMASLSAAGQQGPWADVVTYGPSLTALFGIKSLLGYEGEDRIQEDVADLDPTAGTYGMLAIMAALIARERTGEGQFIDMAQGEAGVAGLAEAVLEYTLNGRVLGPTGNQHRTMAPHGIYRAAGQDSWIAIAVDSDAAWQSLCDVLQCELGDDPRFSDTFGRLQHHAELDGMMESFTVAWDAAALTSELQARGVAAYPVLDIPGVIADEQLDFRRRLTQVTAEGIDAGEMYTSSPWRMSGTPSRIYGPARPLGADDAFVYGELLGLSPTEVEHAAAAGAFS